MLDNYLPVLLFVFIGLAFGVVPFFLGKMLGPNRPGAGKMAAYECGFDAFEDARMKFDVRYYLIAILFILFDLEIAFLFPWAVVFKEFIAAQAAEWFMFGAVMVFLAILIIGYIVEWKNGALDWE
ncbi:MAG: NADH-quinone oxidoreductase subunit A [Azoarcus sp.]|jgi:NADH-quinone oxidoreductase subunit A|nr:NADH-quinone oxidoreductase subunit A [Azoarcus sp.]